MLQDDEIIVLMQLPNQEDLYLVCCLHTVRHKYLTSTFLGLLRGRRRSFSKWKRAVSNKTQTTRNGETFIEVPLSLVLATIVLTGSRLAVCPNTSRLALPSSSYNTHVSSKLWCGCNATSLFKIPILLVFTTAFLSRSQLAVCAATSRLPCASPSGGPPPNTR